MFTGNYASVGVGQFFRTGRGRLVFLFEFHSFGEGGEVIGPFLSFEEVDFPFFDEPGEVSFHSNHFFIVPVLCFRLELGVHLLDFSGSYEVCDGVVVVEDFHSGDASVAVLSWYEFLADDVCHAERELVPDFGLSAFGEVVEDTSDTSGGVPRVESGEDEVTCFGGHKSHSDCFSVSHLADENDVGVFAEHRAQAVNEGVNVSSDFPLRGH